MHLQLRRFYLLLLLITVGFGRIAAQELLLSDANLPQKTVLSPARAPFLASPLKTTTLSLPFFDDFSSDAATPDSLR